MALNDPNVTAGLIRGVGLPGSQPGFNPARLDANLEQVNFETDTVEGRANKIIQADSPLMQRAKSLADQKTNERGLINSSIGVGAAQTAVLDAATQIAAPDAQAFTQQRLANQQLKNQTNQYNVDQINTAEKMKFGADLDMQKTVQSSALAEGANRRSANYNAGLVAVNELNKQIGEINQNKDIQPAAKAVQIQAAKRSTASQLNYLSSLSGIDYGSLLSYYTTVGDGAPAAAVTAPVSTTGRVLINNPAVPDWIKRLNPSWYQ